MLRPFIKEIDDKIKTESKSTEEVKAGLTALNCDITKDGLTGGPFQRSGSLVTPSLDFYAYFPSLDIEKCATLAEDRISKSNIEVNLTH